MKENKRNDSLAWKKGRVISEMRILKILLALCLAFTFAMPAMAQEESEAVDMPILPVFPYFVSVTGTVIEPEEEYSNDNHFVLETKEGGIAVLMISEDTFIADDIDIEPGALLTGFYISGRPMTMQYPPKYDIKLLTVAEDAITVFADDFDENLISSDGSLKLTITEDTEIYSQSGKEFTQEELPGNKLMVYYSISTRSIPAQAPVIKLIVLDEFTDEQPVNTEEPDMSGYAFIVNGVGFSAPAIYQNDNNTTMVPLRVISEALGLTVTWDDETSTAYVGDVGSAVIGKGEYKSSDGMFIIMDAAELINWTTFVPVDFFAAIIGTTATVSETGQLIFSK